MTKKKLEELKEKLIKKDKKDQKVTDLNQKINDFILNYRQATKSNPQMFASPKSIRHLIDKVAIWYELRYPDYDVNRIIPMGLIDGTQSSQEMFEHNPMYQGEENNWQDFCNYETFINALPVLERLYLKDLNYPQIVYLDVEEKGINPETGRPIVVKVPQAHLHLTKDGHVEQAEFLETINGTKPEGLVLKGKSLKEAVEELEHHGIIIPKKSEAKNVIRIHQIMEKTKEGILDCAMYEIIERGGSKLGPRRGLLFASELERDIDIPMKYGIDYSNTDALMNLIETYIELGGKKDLECYEGYFYHPKNTELNTQSLQNIVSVIDNSRLPNQPNEHPKIYTRTSAVPKE